jgi:hypothetical protein
MKSANAPAPAFRVMRDTAIGRPCLVETDDRGFLSLSLSLMEKEGEEGSMDNFEECNGMNPHQKSIQHAVLDFVL